MTLHEKLLALADRLEKDGEKDDAAIVFSAAFQLAPGPKPTIETLTQPIPGYLHYFRFYG